MISIQSLEKRKMHKRCEDFDYRYMNYPYHNLKVRMKDDSSLMSYRGHNVLSTLIRCYFSPSYSTDQRFIYSGSSCGKVFIWDTITGRTVDILNGHDNPIRDVSWHPYQQIIVSSSFDATQKIWGPPTGWSQKKANQAGLIQNNDYQDIEQLYYGQNEEAEESDEEVINFN